MTSGVYKLEFNNGSFYIGKSNDIPKRWRQHIKSLETGTHTKSMQAVFNTYGYPSKHILIECHQDHIDILEAYYINMHWGNKKLLNSSKPAYFTDRELEVLSNYPSSVWSVSTFEHLIQWNNCVGQRDKYKEDLEKSKDHTYIESLKNKIAILEADVEYYKNRGFFAKLFNW